VAIKRHSETSTEAIANMSRQWIGDGSNCYTIEGPSIECRPPQGAGDNKYSALLDDGVSQGEAYWEFSILKGSSVWCGVTARQYLQQGYKTRGMMYGGNVSDGSGLLIQKFGPSVNAGDVIGVLVECSPQGVTVSFFHNNKALGAAFQIPAPYPHPLCPLVGFGSEGGKVKVDRASAPQNRSRVGETTQQAPPCGEWKLVAFDGSVPVQHPSTLSITRDHHSQGEAYRVSGKVVNSFNGVLSRTPVVQTMQYIPGAQNGSGGGWSASPFSSTMMAGPEELMDLERKVLFALGNVKDVSSSNQFPLVISASEGNTSLQLCYSAASGAVHQPIRNNIFG